MTQRSKWKLPGSIKIKFWGDLKIEFCNLFGICPKGIPVYRICFLLPQMISRTKWIKEFGFRL